MSQLASCIQILADSLSAPDTDNNTAIKIWENMMFAVGFTYEDIIFGYEQILSTSPAVMIYEAWTIPASEEVFSSEEAAQPK